LTKLDTLAGILASHPLEVFDECLLAVGHHRVHRSRSHDPSVRVYDEAGNVVETHEHAGEFKEW
jgi:hypothetical protein